jgi:hypothetical protein
MATKFLGYLSIHFLYPTTRMCYLRPVRKSQVYKFVDKIPVPYEITNGKKV